MSFEFLTALVFASRSTLGDHRRLFGFCSGVGLVLLSIVMGLAYLTRRGGGLVLDTTTPVQLDPRDPKSTE
jgi:hypothetical protein